MKVKISDIEIGERHRKEMGDLQPLMDSIEELGLLHPPVINENGELVAGFRRIKAYEELGWEEIPVNRVDIDKVVYGEFDENEIRKDFTATERVAIAKKVLPKEEKKAKERRLSQLKKGDEDPRSEKFTERELGEVKEKTAEKIGWSRPTLDKAIKIDEAIEHDPDEYGDLREKMEDSVHSAHKELKRRRDAEEREKKLKGAPKLKNLILGDCLEEIEGIPDDSIDCVVTDPPYGIETVTGARSEICELRNGWTYDGDDESIYPLLSELFKKMGPKLKAGAHIYIFTSWKAWHNLYPVVDKFFDVRNWLVYLHYVATSGDFYQYRTAASSVMFASNGGKRPIGDHKWNFFDEKGTYRKDGKSYHPAQKSISICKKLIENSTVERENVFDPFCGSGSTLVAAEELNRNWIGIEIEEKWYDVAEQRILEVRKNGE